jgi:hypothetical protein
MTSIKIDEINISDFEFMHQLTNEELLAINGGFPGFGDAFSWWVDQIDKVVNKAKQVVLTLPITQKIILTVETTEKVLKKIPLHF